MIACIADNIISPMGLTTEENFSSVSKGMSMLRNHEDTFGLPEAFCASMLDRELISGLFADHALSDNEYTFFEKLCILSATDAISSCALQAECEDVIFVISTTKGNVDMLETEPDCPGCRLAFSAEKIARYFGNTNTSVVTSNACVSGVCAQIAAIRLLLGEKYRYAVVIGCDVLSRFIISGFQSFKALSPEPCRPFDKERKGLNLGEAAGTMILENIGGTNVYGNGSLWEFAACSNHNDANHISGPSRTGEGAFRVLKDILEKIDRDDIAFVNLHGTATPYNDEMESIALHRSGLEDLPANGFKGYFGHTLGAAGIIETILSMKAVETGVIPATKGYGTKGTTYGISASSATRETYRNTFIKILSGFGGSNAGIAYRRRNVPPCATFRKGGEA